MRVYKIQRLEDREVWNYSLKRDLWEDCVVSETSISRFSPVHISTRPPFHFQKDGNRSYCMALNGSISHLFAVRSCGVIFV